MNQAPRNEPEGYEGVRDLLVGRGYLESPLERLFMGTAGTGIGRGLVGHLVAALLSGALGGICLGALLAAVIVSSSGGVVPAWPDGVLYAALFAPVLGLGVALAELGANLVIRIVSRGRPDLSPRRASFVAGAIVAAGLALYLGGWWARTGAAFDLPGLLALAGLALGAGFAGRVVSAAALAQAVRATGRAPVGPRRTAAVTAALATLVALGAAGASMMVRAVEAQGGAPGSRAADAPERVIVVAWDGLGDDIARGFVREGDLPWLADLMARGESWAVDAPFGADPAAQWTTVATGCEPAQHGVTGIGMTGLRGATAPALSRGPASGPMSLLTRLWPTEERPVRAGIRSVPAAWEVAADATKTAVVGWWGTWPASSPGRSGGYVISDGAIVAARRGAASPEAVYPPTWGVTRAGAWLESAERAAGSPVADDRASMLAREALLTDLFHIEAARDALNDPDVHIAFVYLPGLDILREGWRREGRDLLATLDRVRTHIHVVGSALEGLSGASSERGAPLLAFVGLPGRSGSGPGLAAWAPRAGQGATRRGAVELTRLAPMWLGRAGVTVDDRLCGALGFDLASWTGREVELRRTSAEPARPAAIQEGLEDDLLLRLRALGYVD